MPVFTVVTRAPENANDVFRLRRRGRRLNGLGAEFDFTSPTFQWQDKAPEVQVPYRAPKKKPVQVPYRDPDVPVPKGPSGMDKFAEGFKDATGSLLSFVTEGAGKDLIQAGFKYEDARQSRKDAATAAKVADQRAALAQQQAQFEKQQALREERRMRDMQMYQQLNQQQNQGGAKKWLLPAAIAGGGILAVTMLNK